MGKARFYKFYISISCGVTDDIKREYFKSKFYSKDACNLNYTTADCDFFYESLKEDHYDTGVQEKHLRLINPTIKELNESIDEGIKYLNQFVEDEKFIGGNLIFIFSGHGTNTSGSLVLKDSNFSAKDLLTRAVKERVKNENRLRIDVILDSCFSGAFLINLIVEAWNNFEEQIFLCDMWSSSSFNEVSYEYAEYQHGLFTYVWKSKQEVMNDIDGELHLMVNYQDKLKTVEELTDYDQSPMEYVNGTLSQGKKETCIYELDEITFDNIIRALNK